MIYNSAPKDDCKLEIIFEKLSRQAVENPFWGLWLIENKTIRQAKNLRPRPHLSVDPTILRHFILGREETSRPVPPTGEVAKTLQRTRN